MVLGLFLTWYHLKRTSNPDLSGWDVFTRLRFVVIGGAILLLVTALVKQTRAVLIARFVLGLVVGLLILRRILFPPDAAVPLSTQLGVYVSLIGAILGAAGGLVDTGREVVERYPEMAFWRPPAGELGPEGSTSASTSTPVVANGRSVDRPRDNQAVDSTAEEI